MAKLPISQFLTERLAEYDSTFELRSGTGFEKLFFQPLQFIVQPLRDEANLMQTAQSFRRIVLTDSPNDFSEESVDALANNLFVYRITGSQAAGTARVYYYEAVNREWPTGGAVFSGSNGLRYFNPAPFSITTVQMGAQIEDGLFYFDIPVQAEEAGADYNLLAGGLVKLFGDSAAVAVTNKLAIEGGLAKETNLELISRVQQSIAVRDLVTGKGFNAVLFENFSTTVTELQAIGFGDDEMMRDIIYNTHVGGKVDGYFKGRSVLTGTKDFIGILLDLTRQSGTTATIKAIGTTAVSLGNPNIDRTGGLNPIVRQVKSSTAALYTSSKDLSSPINLTGAEYIKIGIDGVIKNRLRVAGAVPAATSRSEIINAINLAFGVNVAFPYNDTIRIISPTKGLTSSVYLDTPDGLPVASGLYPIFDLADVLGGYTYMGDGPLSFTEAIHYTIDDSLGKITRIVESPVLDQTNGETDAGSDILYDSDYNIFNSGDVAVGDILTITSGPDAGDYRIVAIPDVNHVQLDAELTTTATGVSYRTSHTGIKDGEMLFVQYWYNPLSIDIGNLVKLDADGKTRGVRVGRESMTITDTAFLRIVSIELIDPVTRTPIGTTLKGNGGYGYGGYGRGAYGYGSGAEYYLKVNSPHERYSAFEDSYIVLNSGYQGYSVRVTYEYAPEVTTLHEFVRSERERNLDSDMLMKHFIPAYVSGTISYKVDPTDSSLPTNDEITSELKEFINTKKSGTALEYSDIQQFLTRRLDPYDRYGGYVHKFTLTAKIHNMDGTTALITGENNLTVPTLDPFPKDTNRPLSPRITHWIADNIVLVRS